MNISPQPRSKGRGVKKTSFGLQKKKRPSEFILGEKSAGGKPSLSHKKKRDVQGKRRKAMAGRTPDSDGSCPREKGVFKKSEGK